MRLRPFTALFFFGCIVYVRCHMVTDDVKLLLYTECPFGGSPLDGQFIFSAKEICQFERRDFEGFLIANFLVQIKLFSVEHQTEIWMQLTHYYFPR